MENKSALRSYYKSIRMSIDQVRRKHASECVLKMVAPFTMHSGYVLSYSSFSDELGTVDINEFLLKEKKLVLPKIVGNSLMFYNVTDLENQMTKNSFGMLEPIPSKTKEVTAEMISLALVPALAFDTFNNRLGYGKGFYDRVLAGFSSNVSIIGIGFKEQLHDKPLPCEPHDMKLAKTILV